MMEWLALLTIPLTLLLVVVGLLLIRAASIIGRLLREADELRAQIAAFDGDGDGRIGGSKPRGKG